LLGRADLADVQTLGFDHLRYLQLEVGVKGSSRFLDAHFCRYLGSKKPIVVSI
jgi:hypothetical protein